MTPFEKLVLRWLMWIGYVVAKVYDRDENEKFYNLCKDTHRALEADSKLDK